MRKEGKWQRRSILRHASRHHLLCRSEARLFRPFRLSVKNGNHPGYVLLLVTLWFFQSSPQFEYIDRAFSTNKSLVPSVDRALFRHCPTMQATNYRNTRQSIAYSLHVLWSTIYPTTDTSSSYFLENHQLVATKLLFSFVPREYEIGTNDHICDETVRKWLGTHDLVPRGHDTGVCENTRWQHATVK